jgi:hypothetical protein
MLDPFVTKAAITQTAGAATLASVWLCLSALPSDAREASARLGYGQTEAWAYRSGNFESASHAYPRYAQAKGKSDGVTFSLPLRGRIITGFGARSSGGQNDGINIAVPEGTPVKAAAGGVVAYAGDELKGYGKLILIRHANNFVTAYAHLAEMTVKKGQTIQSGQVVGQSGQTGNVTSPQLHFELRKGATPVDPLLYFPDAQKKQLEVAESSDGNTAKVDAITGLIAPVSARVTEVQRALNDFGYGPLKMTGVLDAATTAAIQKLERDRKLPVTGQIYPRLLRELSALTGRPIE